MRVECPGLILKSEANARGAWQGGWARGKKQKERVMLELCAAYGRKDRPKVPATVTITRLFNGRGKLMDGDNLQRAGKAVRDGIAAFMRADDSEASGIVWHYRQEKGTPGIRVEIEEGGA